MTPRPFALFYNVAGPQPWCVRVGRKWLTAKSVRIIGVELFSRSVLETVYKPDAKRQPHAWLSGVGIVKRTRAGIEITVC